MYAAAAQASLPKPIIDLLPPPGEDGAAYRRLLGASSSVFLVRPDGYAALAAGRHAAPAA